MPIVLQFTISVYGVEEIEKAEKAGNKELAEQLSHAAVANSIKTVSTTKGSFLEALEALRDDLSPLLHAVVCCALASGTL